MSTLKHKVFAYITSGTRLLVFRHPHFPEAGIQVSAGSLEVGEQPDEGVMREAAEDTGSRARNSILNRRAAATRQTPYPMHGIETPAPAP